MPDPSGYTWNTGSRRYHSANGQFVPQAKIRQALENVAETASLDADAATRALQAGEINTVEWAIRVKASIKAAHTANAAVAAGGWRQLTQSDLGTLGSRLRRVYADLDALEREIGAGAPVDHRTLQRVRHHIGWSVGTHEAIQRKRAAKAGATEEKRILGGKNHCDQCLDYAALGWRPIGFLPGIGEDCACRGNCRCKFIYK
ncbi:MAG: hypothetical protein ABI353_16035, partial [Isosphaeraceae bacterium]